MTRLYTLRVTYTLPSGRTRVRNVRDLTWRDLRALQNVLHADTSTRSTLAVGQRHASTR